MSGDWFQVFRGTDARGRPFAVLCIGDSVGKGASAALIATVLASVWKRHGDAWFSGVAVDLPQLFEDFAVSLERTFDGGQQCSTASVALLTEDGVQVASAAAPAWIAVRVGERSIERIRMPPMNPLGLIAHGVRKPVKVQTVAVREGDALMTFTDGVLDGSSVERKLVEDLKASTPWAAKTPELLDALERLTRETGAENALPDDATILFVRRESEATALPVDRALA